MKIFCFSIVPSPYQRDLFHAIAALPDLDLQVYYAERSSPDSPWPQVPLAPYEHVLRGFWVGRPTRRLLVNLTLPDLRGANAIVLNGHFTTTAQYLLRFSRHRCPVVFWAERMIGRSSGPGGWLHRKLTQPLDQVAGVMAIGKGAARDYARRWPGKPLVELPYYCDVSMFSEHIPARPRQPLTLLFCGQMIYRKGLDLLLEAFARLLAEGAAVRLLLVGREAQLQEMLAAHPQSLKQHMEFLGFMNPEQLPSVFRRADVFVLPSRYDGWGVVVNQAVGAGLPIVCSDAVGSAESLVSDGVNGFVFRSGSVEALYLSLRKLVFEPGKIQQFSAASIQLANQLSPTVGACRWVEFVHSLCHR